jgi:TRAP-type C4-dicarboxylate transport system permease small subunit
MQKRIDAAAAVLETLLAVALIGAVLLNFGNVIGRYGFGSTMTIADELQTYTMVYIAFLGAAIAGWRGIHLRMDVLVQRLPPVLKRALSIAESALMVILGSLVTWVGWQYVAQMYALGAKSQTAGIPMWIPHTAIAAGFGLIVLVAILKFLVRAR